MDNDNSLRFKNEYGANDPTPYNAFKSNQSSNFAISYSGTIIEPPKGRLNKAEVLFEMEQLIGKPIHRNTMLTWEKEKLIPEGYKYGKEKFYYKITPYEGLASYLLLHGPLKTNYHMVFAARKLALSINDENANEILGPFGTIIIDETTPDNIFETMMEPAYEKDPVSAYAYFWLRYKVLSVAKLDPLDNSLLLESIRKATPAKDELYKYLIRIK